VTVFNASSAALNQTGLYSLAATSSGCVPTFENIGVETMMMMPPQDSIRLHEAGEAISEGSEAVASRMELSSMRESSISLRDFTPVISACAAGHRPIGNPPRVKNSDRSDFCALSRGKQAPWL
jgi:hypothetical protein